MPGASPGIHSSDPDARAAALRRWGITWHWGTSGGGYHVDSVAKGRAIVPKKKPAPKKVCNAACKKRNIAAALAKWRRKVRLCLLLCQWMKMLGGEKIERNNRISFVVRLTT